MIQYNHGMFIIGTFDHVIQIVDQWNGVINVFFLKISCQTPNYLINIVGKYLLKICTISILLKVK